MPHMQEKEKNAAAVKKKTKNKTPYPRKHSSARFQRQCNIVEIKVSIFGIPGELVSDTKPCVNKSNKIHLWRKLLILATATIHLNTNIYVRI